MKQTNFDRSLLAVALSREERAPLQVQLADALRATIDRGAAPPGARLPASRPLAAELGVSRATALAALEQLRAEGYLVSRRGAGVFVAHDLPPRPAARPKASGRLGAAPPPRKTPAPPSARPEASAPMAPFEMGPDMGLFPHRDWARLLERAWRAPPRAALDRPDPFGWLDLRAAIAAHLADWRGVTRGGAPVDPAHVIVTSGAAEAASLIARAAFRPGAAIALEVPGYGPTARRFAAAGLRTPPAPVDAKGLDPARLPPEASGCFLTPSRHHPLGLSLPLARRRALLAWASATGEHAERVLIEDDYDSEFRFEGRPIPALASLDPGERVIYLGSFSKVFSPALRLGFLVIPPRLTEAFARAIAAERPQASLIPQPALTAFMQSGLYAAHLRRMRRRYGERRRALLAALEGAAGALLAPAPEPSGMHLVCRLRPRLAARMDDQEAARRAAAAGVAAGALSAYYGESRDAPFPALTLGFAAFEPRALEAAAGRLAAALAA